MGKVGFFERAFQFIPFHELFLHLGAHVSRYCMNASLISTHENIYHLVCYPHAIFSLGRDVGTVGIGVFGMEVGSRMGVMKDELAIILE